MREKIIINICLYILHVDANPNVGGIAISAVALKPKPCVQATLKAFISDNQQLFHHLPLNK